VIVIGADVASSAATPYAASRAAFENELHVGAGVAEVIFERELSDPKRADDVAGLFGGKGHRNLV
jgi:hypothetical protein